MIKGKVCVTVTTVSGERGRDVEVELDATHVKLSKVLSTAGVSARDMKVLVDGKPAGMDALVKTGQKVTLTEKVRGS